MGLEAVETILWAEDEFGVKISDAEAGEIRTVGEFSLLIHHKLVLKQGFVSPSEQAVFERIKAYLVSYLKINPSDIHRASEFVKDLGFD